MRTSPIAKMFGKSPIRPIQDHMVTVQGCAEELGAFIDATFAGDWKLARTHYKAIATLENKADKRKRSVRSHLPKSLFMPVPRTDLLSLLNSQDHIANSAQDIAGLMLGRKMAFPASMGDEIREYAKICVATSAQALKVIQELDELVEVGFRGREVEAVEKMIETLDDMERNTDKMQVKIRASLYKLESELPPVEVMFLYRIIDGFGELADYAQKVGHRVLMLTAR
ncbi:MAG: putative phosphate transport protein (TIGR00153 family) [Halieaceae bacterium]|jgi:predicted phosphate transport protein (TIGR00153 family)